MGAGAVVACCSYCLMLSLFTGLHGSAGNGLCKRSHLFVCDTKPYALCLPMTETVQLNLSSVFCVFLPEICRRTHNIVVNIKIVQIII